VWLLDENGPRLAFAAGAPGGSRLADGGSNLTDAAPPSVVECARNVRPVQNEVAGHVAFPILGPLSGILGVLYLHGRSFTLDEMTFLEAVVRQAGMTLEAAHLYERASAETRKSQAILARIADGVVVTDPAGRIMEWNQAAQRLLAPAQDAIGRPCAEVLGLHRGERALACNGTCELLASAQGGAGQEVWRTLSDGRRQPILADVASVEESDGTTTALVHSLRDITKLKQADEAKTLFLATASHELKTPLTVIGGFAQTLVDRGESLNDHQRGEALRAIYRRSQELTTIVNRLLLSSRIEAGRVEVNMIDVDVVEIITERVEAFRASSGRDVRLAATECPPAAADPHALISALDHILENAIKYSPEGGPVHVVVSAGAGISIAVTDHGIGMDAEALAHCTDKFWQAESDDGRRFGGTGIGLYIVRSLVEAMGGGLQFQSRVGAGTTVTLSLVRAGQPLPPARERHVEDRGESSVIKEFMRQIGVPTGRRP
jgi:PAS domain S-box-containing protein